MNVIRDLEDPSKKDKWPKIAKQIIHIKDRNAKPYLKRLFNHEENYVRWEAADKFRAMVDENDIPVIIEMTKHSDHIMRAEGIHAMVNIRAFEFRDELMELLNDPAHNVRREAAKAIGIKNIVKLVPTLENALRDCERRADKYATGSNRFDDEKSVCDEVYIALYLLTDKKYEFKGKNETTEQKASLRKGKVPTLNRAVQ